MTFYYFQQKSCVELYSKLTVSSIVWFSMVNWANTDQITLQNLTRLWNKALISIMRSLIYNIELWINLYFGLKNSRNILGYGMACWESLILVWRTLIFYWPTLSFCLKAWNWLLMRLPTLRLIIIITLLSTLKVISIACIKIFTGIPLPFIVTITIVFFL